MALSKVCHWLCQCLLWNFSDDGRFDANFSRYALCAKRSTRTFDDSTERSTRVDDRPRENAAPSSDAPSLLLTATRWNINPPRHWQSQWHPEYWQSQWHPRLPSDALTLALSRRERGPICTHICARTFQERISGGFSRAQLVFGANLTWRIQVN